MELNEPERHASEVRYWLAHIREQRADERRAYWLKWRGVIADKRGQDAADRLHRDILEGWR